jgi:hypothetical protein
VKKLTIRSLQQEARRFAEIESAYPEPALYGVTDGKAVGTYFEHKFQAYLKDRYKYSQGSSAKGIDFPELLVDMKVTSITQPQSSCPFKSARQKIYGLGYNLLVFVYNKMDDAKTRTARLEVKHVIFVVEQRTSDYQMTNGLRLILEANGNEDDLVAFMMDRFLPVDEIEAHTLAQEVVRKPPELGYLTVSNALQWRLQYGRVITQAGSVKGLVRIR